MRLLVTGGAGFIGSHYVRSLLGDAWGGEKPERVVVLDKLTYAGNRENLAPVADDPRLEFVEGDICDRDLVARLMADVDAVVHFAAESHVDRSIAGASDFVVTNVLGTQTLLDAALARQLPRFVHVSTDEVYGSIAEGSWDESCALEPNSPYSASKASSDLIARARLHVCASDVEGWGQVVIEAASYGVPTVARDVPGLRGSVRPDRTGWLVAESRQADLKAVQSRITVAVDEALTELDDPERRHELADECRAWAAGFSWERMHREAVAHVVAAITTTNTHHRQPGAIAPEEKEQAR